jgi:hypothetical protein
MKLGFVTACLPGWSLAQLADWRPPTAVDKVQIGLEIAERTLRPLLVR